MGVGGVIVIVAVAVELIKLMWVGGMRMRRRNWENGLREHGDGCRVIEVHCRGVCLNLMWGLWGSRGSLF
jgi:hypothetical protein